ncbi:hypothetical protein PV318_03230 [Streptomyces sp. ME02-6991-2B]|nr:hypothetical protein [Streptomyces sp. ME02-6991-2B]
MDTYATRGARTKTTGHYRRPGTRTLYCGRPAGTPNGIFATVKGWKLCARCVKAAAADRAEAQTTAAAHLAPAVEEQPLPAVVDAIEAATDTLDPDDDEDDTPTLPAVDTYAARLTRATWRDRFISTARGVQLALDDYRATDHGDQGALFAI